MCTAPHPLSASGDKALSFCVRAPRFFSCCLIHVAQAYDLDYRTNTRHQGGVAVLIGFGTQWAHGS